MELFSTQEITAILALLNRCPMTPAEQLFAQGFVQRLVAFCQPASAAEEEKSSEPTTES